MDWRLNSSAPVSASDLRAHLEGEAAKFIRASCPPPHEEGGLAAPVFVDSKVTVQTRAEMATVIDALCALADSVDATSPGAKFLASFSDVLSVEGGRRINLSIDEAMPALSEPETVDVTEGKGSLEVGG